MSNTNDVNKELAEKCLNFAKRCFKEFTGTTMEVAKELIALDEQYKAINKPTDNKVVESKQEEAPAVVPTPVVEAKKPEPDPDLPF